MGQQATAIEFFSHVGQAIGTGVEGFGETAEQRSFLLELKQIELGNDEVAFFAGATERLQTFLLIAAQPLSGFWKHAGKE